MELSPFVSKKKTLRPFLVKISFFVCSAKTLPRFRVCQEKTRLETETITAKVWSKSFPEHEPNQELLSSFREGLDSRYQVDFWRLYEGLRKGWQGKHISQAVAVHHLQAVGALGKRNPGAMMIEILKAVAANPCWTIKTLKEGIFRPKRIVF